MEIDICIAGISACDFPVFLPANIIIRKTGQRARGNGMIGIIIEELGK